MKVFRIKKGAKLPEKKTEDMCYDVFACLPDPVTIVHGKVVAIPTGIKIAPPPGYHFSLRPRSGLAAKYGIDVLAGQIDGGYRGELIVLLTTHKSDSDDVGSLKGNIVTINNGDKIAQFKLEKDETFDIEEVFSEKDLGTSERMEKGFGSSDA